MVVPPSRNWKIIHPFVPNIAIQILGIFGKFEKMNMVSNVWFLSYIPKYLSNKIAVIGLLSVKIVFVPPPAWPNKAKGDYSQHREIYFLLAFRGHNFQKKISYNHLELLMRFIPTLRL